MPGPKKGAKIQHRRWVERAIKLSAEGMSTRRIAEKLGLDHTTVWRGLEKEFQRAKASDEEVAARRELLRERVERLLEKWTPKAMAGDKDAALVVHRFLERLAKLDGVDAPQRNEVSGPSAGPMIFRLDTLNEDQIDRLAGGDPSVLEGAGESGEGAEGAGS